MVLMTMTGDSSATALSLSPPGAVPLVRGVFACVWWRCGGGGQVLVHQYLVHSHLACQCLAAFLPYRATYIAR